MIRDNIYLNVALYHEKRATYGVIGSYITINTPKFIAESLQ
jgi:hypothetical protein